MKLSNRLLMYLLILLMVLLLLPGCKQIKVFIGMNVGPEIKVTSIVPAELLNGESVTITIEGSDPNDDKLTITWKVEDEVQEGETGESFTFSATPAVTDVFEIKVTVSDGTESVSKTFLIQVLAPGQQTLGVSISGNSTVANGSILSLTAELVGATDLASIIYKWFVDGVEEAGATTSLFEFSREPSVETEYTIRVIITEGNKVAEDTKTVTVLAPGVAYTDPEVWIWGYSGELVSAEVSSGNGYSFPVMTNEAFSYYNNGYTDTNTTFEWYVDNVLIQSAATAYDYGDNFYHWEDVEVQTTFTIKVIAREGDMEAQDTCLFIVNAPPISAPTITPGSTYSYNATWVGIGDEITIETTTDGASIYYTTDGTDPKTSPTAQLYSAPFAIPKVQRRSRHTRKKPTGLIQR